MFYYSVEQRSYIQALHALGAFLYLFASVLHFYALHVLRIVYHDSLTCDTVKYREIQLRVIGFKIHEQLVYFINYLFDTCVLLVDLVYQQYRVDALLERFLQHESRLRHRALTGIHE